MDKRILVGIAVIALIGTGGAYAAFNRSKIQTQPQPQPEQNSPAPVESANTPKSLKELMSAGAQKCEFKDNQSGADIEGIVFNGNNKIRGDFSTTSEGQKTTGHMIIDEKIMYTWVDNPKIGFKATIDANQAKASANQQFDPDKKLDFKCSGWSIDASVFALPADIKFSEITIPSPNASVSKNNSSQCSACDAAPAEARAQCRAALGCN